MLQIPKTAHKWDSNSCRTGNLRVINTTVVPYAVRQKRILLLLERTVEKRNYYKAYFIIYLR